MSTIFSGLNVALRALLAHQQAQLITDHNIANANTPGYSRQEAVLNVADPYMPPAMNRPGMELQLGAGVSVTNIRRFTLDFFDTRLRTELSASAEWDERSAVLRQVQAALPESDTTGLGIRLDAFWSAWQGVVSDPTSLAQRQTVINSAINLTQMIQDRYNALGATRESEDQQIVTSVNQLNDKAQAVARLNSQIISAMGMGDEPNDLLDQRDILLDQMSQLAGVTIHLPSNGDAYVSLGGHILVAGGQAQTLSTVIQNPLSDPMGAPTMHKIIWQSDGSDASLSSGSLAGARASRDVDVVKQMQNLDSLAQGLMAQVNGIHSAAVGLDGTSNAFFSGTGARDIAVNAVVANAPNKIGAASATGTLPGDASQALAIAQLSQSLIMSGGTRTFNSFVADAVAQLGTDAQRAKVESLNHTIVKNALAQQKGSVVGVSLDEEAARLVQSQRAYEAAARALTAFDQMADTIINRMGVVGR
ncbi:MAG: flagellar hook-associated protein FlgK [Chloroflexi bacterium]|nr:flagellar hook-associated protein FlgK [Chloroflexota bacterium]